MFLPLFYDLCLYFVSAIAYRLYASAWIIKTFFDFCGIN